MLRRNTGIKWVTVIGLVGILVAVSVAGVTVNPKLKSPPPAKEVKKIKAPDFNLKDLNGNPVKLSDYKGRVVLINFWATWCPPCRMEIPHFIELQKKYQGKGFVIIGISRDEDGIDAVKPFVNEFKINYQVLLEDDKVADDYGGIVGIPTSFLVDTEGNQVKKYYGYTETSEIEKDMRPLLPKIEAPKKK